MRLDSLDKEVIVGVTIRHNAQLVTRREASSLSYASADSAFRTSGTYRPNGETNIDVRVVDKVL